MDRIYFKNYKRKTALTIEDLKQKGQLYSSDLIWYDGLEKWKLASEIEELKDFILNEAPLSRVERRVITFKKAIAPSLLIYFLLSVIIGVISGLLELYQYEKFFEEVKANSIQYQKEDDKLTSGYNSDFPISSDKPSFSGYSNIRQGEIYSTRENGTRFTRWSTYSYERGGDNEQLSYQKSYNFLFRPYKALFGHANLSVDERSSIPSLLGNFILSSLITNLLFFPLVIFIMFLKKAKAQK